MSETLSRCQNCGVEFQMPQDEVVSSRILCPPCAAERRAKLRAAKATGAETGDGGRAAAPAQARTAAATEAARPSRRKEEYHAHHKELQAAREAANKHLMKIAWGVTGGLALLTGIVLLFVKNKQDTKKEIEVAYEQSLDDFKTKVLQVDLNNEDALKAIKALIDKERKLWKGSRIEGDVSNHLSKINGSLYTKIKTRSLTDNLDSIDQKLATNPDTTAFAAIYTQVRDADLQLQATDAGGEYKARYDSTRQRITERYIEALRGACRSAATATSGDGLAPFGTLEDLLRTAVFEARATNDVEATKKYEPMLQQTYGEINAICSRLFDDAYQNKVQWTDLLTDPGAWTAVPSSFKCKFSPLTLSNPAGDSSQSCGISYFPAGDNWRDYVLDMEFKLDSGVMVFYTRVGEKMDTKEVPGFSIGGGTGGKQVQVVVDYGKTNTMTVSTIGNQMTVKLNDQIVFGPEDIKGAKSRKGEPGIVVQAGPALATELTITKLRARLLRQ